MKSKLFEWFLVASLLGAVALGFTIVGMTLTGNFPANRVECVK
jgi:hypothetical protein